jgi:hypothetical protein
VEAPGDGEIAAGACSGEVGTGSPIKNMRNARIYSHFRHTISGIAIQSEWKWL